MTELKTDLKLNNLEDLLNACLDLEADVTKENKEAWSEISALAMGCLNLRTRIDKVLAMEERQNIRSYENPDYARGWNKALREIQAILGGE